MALGSALPARSRSPCPNAHPSPAHHGSSSLLPLLYAYPLARVFSFRPSTPLCCRLFSLAFCSGPSSVFLRGPADDMAPPPSLTPSFLLLPPSALASFANARDSISSFGPSPLLPSFRPSPLFALSSFHLSPFGTSTPTSTPHLLLRQLSFCLFGCSFVLSTSLRFSISHSVRFIHSTIICRIDIDWARGCACMLGGPSHGAGRSTHRRPATPARGSAPRLLGHNRLTECDRVGFRA